MSFAHNPDSPHADAEALLGSLAGVVSAHVVTGVTGNLTEIHILARAGLHPKQVVRNVESALSAGLGLTIDRRIISVAQVRTEEPLVVGNGQPGGQTAGNTPGKAPGKATGKAPGKATGKASARSAEDAPEPVVSPDDAEHRRLEFVRYRSHRHGSRCMCEVVLRSGDRELVGQGTGANTAAGRAEAAARAVLDGIGNARPDLRLELAGAAISSSQGRTYVIVAAHILVGREPVPLAGAAAMTRSPEEAAIFASLQATNRWSS